MASKKSVKARPAKSKKIKKTSKAAPVKRASVRAAATVPPKSEAHTVQAILADDGALTEADRLASKQREISVSEFFLKNRHLLGFDNPKKALLTTIKEAVDNSLDACEEAKILPEILIEIKQLEEDRFFVAVEDNGPGVVMSRSRVFLASFFMGPNFTR